MRAAAGIASVLGIAVLFHEVAEPRPLAPAAPLGVGAAQACEDNERCDTSTGCLAPQAPFGPALNVLPTGPAYERYVRELAAFRTCRERALAALTPVQSAVLGAAFSPAEFDRKAFADSVAQWNGDIFWVPASKSSNAITRSGDEARAVFGPIPEGDCDNPHARVIPREVDGNIVDLKPNLTKPEHPLEFVHRDQNGDVVKWTSTLPKCDKPSLTGSSTYCGLNSRLERHVRGNVEWLFFCRKSHSSQEVSTDSYWQRSDPRFALFGTIGFNRESGEIVFFDGRKDQEGFDWLQPFVPPGGRSYADAAGRAAAEALYDPTFQISCHACHDNKSPYVIDPHIVQARVGYRSADGDPRAAAFSLGDFLPQRPRSPDTPFRVVGSGYTSTYKVELMQAKTVEDPTGNCTGCHTLTTQITGRRFAADAVARKPTITLPSWVQLLEQHEETKIYEAAAAHRTDWALGSGGIHPWMVPGSGNDLSNAPRLSAQDWQELSDCLWQAGDADCRYRPLYTPCPAPESEGEGSSLADLEVQVLPAPPGEAATTRVIRVGWTYGNSYGGVPERDDVRVNVAVGTSAIPANGEPPESGAYPSVDQAKGFDVEPVSEAVGAAGSTLVIQNVSYAGHTRWTDPTPAVLPRKFKIDMPGKCSQRTLIRLLPKRFCFDPSEAAYGPADHLIYADVTCD